MSDQPPSAMEAGDPSANLRGGLLSAFRKLLRPLVRILIRHGIAYAEFGEVVKSVYVDCAVEDFALPGRKTSGSRVAILTGLTRKEVKPGSSGSKCTILPLDLLFSQINQNFPSLELFVKALIGSLYT